MTSITTVADAERLERDTSLRIKFAALSPRGDLMPDASDEYEPFFRSLPEDWTASSIGLIETRREFQRPSWELTNGRDRLLAVEHETGLELLLFGMLTNFLSGAVTALAVWSWRKWSELRKTRPSRQSASFVIEVPRSAEANAEPLRIVLPPPVTDDEVMRFLRISRDLVRQAPNY